MADIRPVLGLAHGVDACEYEKWVAGGPRRGGTQTGLFMYECTKVCMGWFILLGKRERLSCFFCSVSVFGWGQVNGLCQVAELGIPLPVFHDGVSMRRDMKRRT